MDQLAAHRHDLERLNLEIKDQAEQEVNNRQGLERLNEFCDHVSAGLDKLSFDERQRFLRLVVDGIVVEDRCVKVDTNNPSDHDLPLRHCRGEPVVPPFFAKPLRPPRPRCRSPSGSPKRGPPARQD